MSVTVPNALALTNIADGAAIVASDHRNNYAAAQVGVNGLIAMFAAAPTKGDLIVSRGGGVFDRLPVGADGLAIVADSTQPLGMKYAAAGATTYRKTTAKAVNTTVAATDLLNAEITIAAGAMGTTGLARLTAWGNYLQNSGGNAAMPRFQLILGGTTLLDTGTTANSDGASATRGGWKIVAEILNLGAANAQLSSLHLSLSAQGGLGAAGPGNVFTTGDGYYTGMLNGTGGIVIGRVAEGTNSTAVDTSTAKTLVLNVINGSASATYETKLLGALVEII